MGLRAEIEEDLAETLEDLGDFGMVVILISPDGAIQTKSANDHTLDLSGQVLYDTLSQTEDGVTTVDNGPVVSLRRSSLDRVPEHGETWAVKVPESPIEGAPIVTFLMERAPLDGRSIGFIRMILRDTEQS